MTALRGRRRSGISLPLFSCPSTRSWGIGEIVDLLPLVSWLASAGQRVAQLLPLNEMASGQHSPYSALSAMAVDPIYVHLPSVADFSALGGEASLGPGDRDKLRRARQACRIEYALVRELKDAALAASFDRFREADWCRDTARARLLEAFLAAQAWWVEEYALFRAIQRREGNRPWTEWSEPLRRRDPAALDRARRELSREVLFHQYVQWVADEQWHQARRAAASHAVELFGDLPFMVDLDSVDVWTRQDHFRLDATLGAPPDAFSLTGQDWGMPVYRWDVMATDDFEWLRDRARRMADLYSGYRVDHLVGFYRTYGRPIGGGAPFFTPAAEPEQLANGERVLNRLRAAGAEIIAEDLGTVPDFVRESLARLHVPGLCVFRWERDWQTAGQPLRDPRVYPVMSVATSGTHDTEPLATWWDGASREDRLRAAALPTIRGLAGGQLHEQPFDPIVRDVVLEALFASSSDLLLLPFVDVFGWRHRINLPATISEDNWTFRLPWPSDRLDEAADARERQASLRAWAERHGRL